MCIGDVCVFMNPFSYLVDLAGWLGAIIDLSRRTSTESHAGHTGHAGRSRCICRSCRSRNSFSYKLAHLARQGRCQQNYQLRCCRQIWHYRHNCPVLNQSHSFDSSSLLHMWKRAGRPHLEDGRLFRKRWTLCKCCCLCKVGYICPIRLRPWKSG